MKLKNIYVSGPDGSRKTSMSFAIRFFLEARGERALVVHFPAEVSAAADLLGLVKEKRLTLGKGAEDLLFVADRLDIAHLLRRLREKDPQVVFVFDRGPADGVVYAQARDNMREEPLGLKIEEIEKWDSKFLEMFPVDIGFYLQSSMRGAARLMIGRQGIKEMDEADRDTTLQTEIRKVFDIYLGQQPGWTEINVDCPKTETEDESERRIIKDLFRIVSEKSGHPKWTEEKGFEEEIDQIRGRISEQVWLVEKEKRHLRLGISPERR